MPFYLHIDEGTGLRKSAVLIITAQVVFGQETADRFKQELSGRSPSRQEAFNAMTRAQFHSSRGSTYKSRFLFTCLPKKWYTRKNSSIYGGMLQTLASECLDLFTDGIKFFGETYYFVCLGLKADQPAQAKAGNFNRYFANMGRDKGCCYECLAGRDAFPFEEISRSPSWLPTIDTVVPWAQESALLQIPHREFQSATFFKRDPFHIWKQSIGGHYVASSVVLLMDLQFWHVPNGPNSVDALFERASFDFGFWARHEWRGTVRPNIKQFTRQLFHFTKANQYPFGRFKGSDMLLLTRWIRHIVGHGLVFEGDILRSGRSLIHGCSPGTKQILQQMFGAAGGALDFFHDLHTSGIWLPPNVSSKMAESCLQFCEGYEALARHCHNLGLCRFHLEPSLHGFLHFHFDLRDRQCMAWNPAVHSCEPDEDYVGKIARLARCVHAATTTVRVIDRILIKTYFELEEPDL